MISGQQVHAEPLTIEIIGGGAGPSTPPTGCGTVLGINSESYLLCPTQQANISDDGSDTVKVQTRPNAPLMQDIPPGWNPPASGQMQPTPPSTTTKLASTYYGSVYGFTGDSIQAVCQRAADLRGATLISYNAGQCIDSTSGGNPMESVTLVSNICPRGYTSSGSSCALSNASQVDKPTDGKCTVLRSGNTFSGDPQDPDCGLSQRSAKGLSIGTNAVSVTKGGDTATVTANTGDSTITIVNKQSDVASNSTKVGTTTINPQYNISGFKQETFNGVGTQQSSTPIAPGGGGSTIDVSSLNKEATQGAISNKVTQIYDAMTTAPGGTDLQTHKDALNTAADTHRAKIEEIGTNGLDSHGISWSWFPTIPTSTCSPVDYGVSGHMFSWDICPTVEKVRDLSGFVLYIITAMGLFSILTGRKEA